MKKMITEPIPQQQKDTKNKKINKNEHNDAHQDRGSPKRSQPSVYQHRQKPIKKGLFSQQTFCFPFVTQKLSQRLIDALNRQIQSQGGKVVQFQGSTLHSHVDFLLIDPETQVQKVLKNVKGKIKFKQILDCNYVVQSISSQAQLSFQAFSLYVNIQGLEDEQKQSEKGIHSNKKRKMQEEQHQSTVRLDNSQYQQQPFEEIEIKDQKIKKIQIQQALLKQKQVHSFSINKFIAQQLTKLMKIYAAQKDLGRKIAYSKASAVIRALPKEIQTQKDVDNIKGIGPKISDKIKQLLQTGKVSKLQKLQQSQKNVVSVQLSKVWGIGPSKALQLYNAGIKSIQDLRKHQDLLTRNQKLGLKYHQQLQQKIPRQKVIKVFAFLQNVLKRLVPSIDDYRMEICGSYRRGKSFCGDIDLIIARKDGTHQKNLLNNLITQLQNSGFLTDHLTHPKPPQGRSSCSYMGIFTFQDKTHHRIDIKHYPIQQFAYAILYFTGSGMFNRMMRLHCMKLGLNLSDHGAHPKINKGVLWSKPIPNCYTQQDIFKFLQLDYKTPQQRQM